MNNMRTAIIVAAAENNAIGKDNKMLWRLSGDMKHFRELTTGHAVIMGRKTYESLGKPLPGRMNIIITRNPAYTAEGCAVVAGMEEALNAAREAGHDMAFIIGGGEIYKQYWNKADILYLTRVHTVIGGDTFIPSDTDGYWAEKERSLHKADEKNEYDYSFITYVHQ